MFFKKSVIYLIKPANKPWSTVLKVASMCVSEREGKEERGRREWKRIEAFFGYLKEFFY